jgi:hypothetical protein
MSLGVCAENISLELDLFQDSLVITDGKIKSEDGPII